MSKATRQDLIKSISAGIEYAILKEGQIKPENSPQFRALVEGKATAMLEKYEGSMRPSFWYGVCQSVTGAYNTGDARLYIGYIQPEYMGLAN